MTTHAPTTAAEKTAARQEANRKHVAAMPLASVYPHYVTKVERKGRTKAELDAVLCWLTGYSQEELEARIADRSDLRTFFAEAPSLNPARSLIKGVVCGVRVEEIEDPLMREIRYMDKVVDELAKGKALEKVMRAEAVAAA